MKTVDRRIIKTKLAIRGAFMSIIQEKSLNSISISELTKQANITRSTFYMYYDSIAAVRDEIEDEMITNFDRFFPNKNVREFLKNPYPFLRKLADMIISYDEMNRYLICTKHEGHLMDKIKKYIVNSFIELVPKERTAERINALYVVTFLTSGIVDCFKTWYMQQNTVSLEELCRHFSDIIVESAKLINR